jgi:hypothetical protein
LIRKVSKGKMMKLLTLIAVLFVLGSLLAGCSKEETYAPGESPKEQAMKIKPGAGGGPAPVAGAGGAGAKTGKAE